MKLHAHFKYRKKGANLGALRLVLVGVLSFFISFAQVVPVSASHVANDSSVWVEICSDGGTYLAQVDQGEGGQMPDCMHCAFCIVPIGDVQILGAGTRATKPSTAFTLNSYFVDRAASPKTPEQFWSACRGPPIVSTDNNMNSNTSLTNKEPVGSAFEAWSISCV